MSQKSFNFFLIFEMCKIEKDEKTSLILFVSLLSFSSFAQLQSEKVTKFQQEHQALQNEVQLKLAQVEADYEKELAIITQNYKLEIAKLQAEYDGNPVKNVATQEKYKKEAGKITNKYDLLTKDVIFKSTVDKAKIENEYYHERKKLMDKYEVYITD